MVNHVPQAVELVGLCDPVVARCQDACEGYGLSAGCFSDYDRMLAETHPDLVVVVSPEHVHAEHIVKALDAGCRVATEKPLCTTAADAARILEAEQRSGSSLFMGFNYRHIPLCSKIREVVCSGAIGRPVSVDLTWYLDYRGHGASYFRRWHRLLDKSGGLLVTKASHHFDLVNWWIGDHPERVFAECARNFFGKGHGPYQGTRCRDCAHQSECPFFFDIGDRARKSRELGYKANIVRDYEGDTCVFSDDIDIYDTMAVMVRYAGGAILNYTLNAAVPYEGWNLAINGTKGRMESGITDNKPSPGWQARHQIVGPKGQLLKGAGYRVTDWPDAYAIHVMPHAGDDYQIRVPNIADGHGGGDQRVFDAFFMGTLDGNDPLALFATARDGAMSMLIGAAANQSAATGQSIDLTTLL